MRATTARIPFCTEDGSVRRHPGGSRLGRLRRGLGAGTQAIASLFNDSAWRRRLGWAAALSALLSALAAAAVLAQRSTDPDGRAFRAAARTAGIAFWIVMVFAVLIADELRRLALRDREEEESRFSVLPPDALRGSAVLAEPYPAAGEAPAPWPPTEAAAEPKIGQEGRPGEPAMAKNKHLSGRGGEISS
jgi:hypothetical protein